MGKQKKPRHRRRHKDGKQHQKSAESSGPPLISRIRHADPQTRLAALTALAQRSSSSSSVFDAALWQAVCEQIVVRPGFSISQLSIATLAATLLAEWTSGPAMVDIHTGQAAQTLTAGWPLVLQGQLQTCLTVWKDLTSTQHIELWGQFALQCLYAWTALIESNPVVMDRVQQGTSRNDSLNLLKEWLLVSTSPTTHTTTTTTTTTQIESAIPAVSTEMIDLQSKLGETTARALHSLLQDNPAVVEPWWDDATCDSSWLITQIPPLLQGCTSTLVVSPVTRLHLAGVWLTVRNILAEEAALQEPSVLNDVVRILQDALVVLPSHTTTLPHWQDCYQKASEQTQDDLLERQVLRRQTEKHESAREIARRLAGGKVSLAHGKNHHDGDDNDNADVMEEEPEQEEGAVGTPKSGQLPIERPDHVQHWQDTLQEWEQSLRPVELALEIIAHVTAVAPDDAVMMLDDDDNHVDMVMPMATATTKAWDAGLQPHLNELPGRLFACFQSLYAKEWTALPPPMASHWSDLQSKASTGLGHCLVQLSSDPTTSTMLDMSPSQFWRTLWSAVQSSLLASTGRQAILGLVVVVLQTRPEIRQEVSPTELDFLLQALQSTSTQQQEESHPVIREAIVILGILCSQQEHPEAINKRVCAALISRLEKDDEAIVIRAEALNVLMDIYGNDDCHPDIFEQMQVLTYFEKSLPILKQQISRVNRETVDSNDLEYWRETALNVGRFIEYKHESSL